MEIVITLLGDNLPYLPTQSLLGRVVLGFSVFLVALFLFLNRKHLPKFRFATIGLILFFSAAAAAANLYAGVLFSLPEPFALIGQIGRQETIALMIFGQLPVILAAGFSGPVGGMLAGAAGGYMFAGLQSHNPLTIVEFAFVGALAGMMFFQPFRTRFYRLLARPLPAGLLLAMLYPVIFIIGVLLWFDLPANARLDYVIHLLWPIWAAVGTSLVFGGALAEIARIIFRTSWGYNGRLIPSPSESSIAARSFSLMGLVVALLAGALSAIGWALAYQSSLQLMEDRVDAAATAAAQNVPVVLDIGQNLILSVAQDSRLTGAQTEELSEQLDSVRSTMLYFQQLLLVLDDTGSVLVSSGPEGLPGDLTSAERAGIELARQGVPFQYYTSIFPADEARAVISFIVPLETDSRVLVGRSALSDNPFTEPLINHLNSFKTLGGSGVLVNEAGLIMFHPKPEMIGADYYGDTAPEIGLVSEPGPGGTRILLLGVNVPDRPWRVYIDIPATVVQDQALRIAGPLVGLLFALALISTILLWLILRVVTASLRNLSVEANRIAENPRYLDSPLETAGADEVGAMRKAFERMRVSLKARMDEQRQLLLASHGAAASLDFGTAVKPLLTAALSGGAVSARVVLRDGALSLPGSGELRVFGAGTATGSMDYLDSQILKLNSGRSPLVIQNPPAFTGLQFRGDRPVPAAIAGAPLVQENAAFGTLWVAYDRPHQISDNEIRFLSTLAAQGALAAANARLFLAAEVDRERLAAILSSTPDPVIVTDQDGNLFLANPSACEVFGDALSTGRGLPITEILPNEALVSLLVAGTGETHINEIVTGDGKTYTAKTTSVKLKNRELGTVCVLRDVTRYKELDIAKSDLVSHVGHELRTPLQIIRGFAMMLPMVGDISGEQQYYVDKIVNGVERMKRLISDLLEVGRLESALDLRLAQVSALEIVSTVADSLISLAQAKEIALLVEAETVVGVEIEADKMYLERALSNLVENAIKYSDPGGRVTVSAGLMDGGAAIRFTVTDSGIGISPADQDRLFEKFFRSADRKARREVGTGLGLAIVKLSVERHHGQIGVESVPGRGSRFYFSLPLRQPKTE